MHVIELQAVVFAAGRGTRLPELTRDYPKCLLPVGPYPLLYFPLNMLQQHGFQDVIIIVLECYKSEIQQAIERTPLKLKLDYVTIPSDSDFGTVDSLRYIFDKIKSDIVAVSCDVVTNVSLYPLINKFRQHDASIAALFFNGVFDWNTITPGPKNKQKPERDLVGMHPQTGRLVFLASTSDFDETFDLNGHLLRKNGKIDIFSRLVDSHIYVLRRWILDFLKKKDYFSTLRGELLPYIVKKQVCRPSSSQQLESQSEYAVNVNQEDEIFHFYPENSLDQRVTSTSLFNDSAIKDPYNGDIIRCYAIKAPKDSFGVRVNTTASFFGINQKISSLWSILMEDHALLVSANATIQSTQMKDISVAPYAVLSEKTSLSRSVFGSHCSIDSKVIITNSIIMAHAKIEEGCNIENSIIGYKAIVKKGSTLKNCLVGPNYIVEEGSIKQMTHLTNADAFMAID